MAVSLQDKVVLITGASSGFGEEAALLFAREGASVVLAARRIDRMQAQVERLQSEGCEAMATPVDVANPADIKNMVKSVMENYDRIDILFNNAGFGRLDWFEKLNPARDIHTQVAVNLTGLMYVTHEVLPHMLKRKSGHIINMSSVAGWTGSPQYAVYSATKFGVRGFTESLRRELMDQGIMVSGVYPGPASTEFTQHSRNDPAKHTRVPAAAKMSSEYVAQQVVNLAKNPRRDLILPWWMAPLIWLDNNFPTLADWVYSKYARKRRSENR